MIDLKPMLDAARQAASLTKRIQAVGFDRVNKDADGDPVTVADYSAQAILCRALALAYPDHGVLAEEGGDQFASLLNDSQREHVARLVGDAIRASVSVDQVVAWLDHGRAVALAGGGETTWIIDPVDGTKGFVAGRQYAIAIAALADGEPVAGVIACPGYGNGLLLYAQGSGAYVEDLNGGRKPSRIAVSSVNKFNAARIVGSLERHKGDHPGIDAVYAALGIRRDNVQPVDSQAKYAMVACGDADIFMRLMTADAHKHYVWDHAPGVALVRAAGGVATDMDGSPLRFAPGQTMPNRGMVVTNGHLHDKLLEAIQPLLKD
ncbi:MAG: inositol monophosphatase family protein [Chloroflexota bacterium]|nr:inositol monophosphatase family protein [Chloroflexota bacterium]